VATLKEDKSLARFERVAVLLSGGGALGAYQAGALAAMELGGYQASWLVGTATGAINAAIVAGSAPRQRVALLRNFWRRLGVLMQRTRPASRFIAALRRCSGAAARRAGLAVGRPLAEPPPIEMRRLRELLSESIDFARLNAGAMRLSLAATHIPSGAEVIFDNDRHVIGIDHLLASVALPVALPPVWIAGEPYGSPSVAAVTPLSAVLDGAPPADTLCFVIDCCDPTPANASGLSRAGQQIAAYRRQHDLRRIIGMIGERLPEEARRDPELRRALTQGSTATMNLVHLVHESDAADLTGKLADFSPEGMALRWRAGERDMLASLDRATWLAPPPRRVGVVVHELRGGSGKPS
jgi:NTE family protein